VPPSWQWSVCIWYPCYFLVRAGLYFRLYTISDTLLIVWYNGLYASLFSEGGIRATLFPDAGTGEEREHRVSVTNANWGWETNLKRNEGVLTDLWSLTSNFCFAHNVTYICHSKFFIIVVYIRYTTTRFWSRPIVP